MTKCVAHRSYEAKSAPRTLCVTCWEIFMEHNPDFRRIIEEAHALVVGR